MLRELGVRVSFLAVLVLLATPTGASAEADHLTGYKVKDADGMVANPPERALTDAVGGQACKLGKAAFLMLPSEKDGGDDVRGAPTQPMICYKAKCEGPQVSGYVNQDQFGSHTLSGKKARIVCAPAAMPCEASYELVNGTCVDVNECDDGANPCGDHGTCNNEQGAPYTCTCDAFYEEIGGTCVDVNECDDAFNPCGDHGTCNNEQGAPYTCNCDAFYEEINGTCVDVNECDDGANPCGDHGTCNNEQGAPYTCACDAFYEFVGGTCVPV